MRKLIKEQILASLNKASDELVNAAKLMSEAGYSSEAQELYRKAEQIDNRAGIIRVTTPTRGAN